MLLLAAMPVAMAEAKPELTKVTLEIDGLICSACVDTVEEALKAGREPARQRRPGD